MKKKKLYLTGLLFIVSLCCFSSCSGKQESSESSLQIGVVCYDQRDTFLGELINSFRKEIASKKNEYSNISVTYRDSMGSQRTQDDQVKELIAAGCDVLCVNLVDRADPSEIIDYARDNQIPIVFFNREPVSEDLMQWDRFYYVGADAKQSGVIQGELVVKWIQEGRQLDRNRDGKIQYVVLEGEAGHQDAIIRTENAVNTIKEHGIVLEKLSYQMANWNRAQAQNRMMQMISQYGNEIELVLANNDDMALGAMDAYQKLNYTESALPVFFGIDGTEAGLQAVADGKIAGTVYNDKEGQAKAMADLAVSLAVGEEIDNIEFKEEPYIYLPYFEITKENVADYLGEEKSRTE